MFSRIAVISTGEPAVRLIRAVRELNEEFGYGIKVIALHTAAERGALSVRLADERVRLRDKDDLDSPHLDHAELERAMIAGNVDACWPGWGSVSEDAGFVELCDRIAVRFIGPPAASMRRLGDIERTRSEAQKAFNDPMTFVEKLVHGGRHIEVQIIADNYGNVWAPGIRDCTIQRRHQKLIEESGSPALTAEQDAELRRAAVALVKQAGYRGAGTVEFLYQPKEKTFAFLKVITRLQVEHSITELSTGLDLVKLQIMLADGHRLVGDPPPNFGNAIEARLNAEDADNGFARAPGKVELLTLPTGPGIRVHTGIAIGDEITADDDPMIAKIIAWGRDRSEAMARLRVALRETTVVVKGGTTTKSFLMELLSRPEVTGGTADTGWLDRAGLTDRPRVAPHADAALLYVGVAVYEAEEAWERESFLRSARGGRPRAGHAVGREVQLGYQGQTYSFNVAQISPFRFLIEIADGRNDGKRTVVDVEIDRIGEFESRLTFSDREHRIVASTTVSGYLVEVDGVSHRVSRDGGGVVRSPAPAVVVAVRAAAGTDVEAGDTILILESMKMETPVKAPYAGRVREILVGVNSQVDRGGSLVRIDRIDDGAAASTTPTVEFT
ncbi:MAG: biotin carboxylase N-terminal domain-containing protein, partial [Nakamurella sp.]